MSGTITKNCRGRPTTPRLAGVAFVVGLSVAGAGVAWGSPAAAQGQKAGEQPCAGEVSGYLGIGLGDCRGCALTLTPESKGGTRAWSFATEPRIAEIAPDSPAAGVLQAGDEIVGIDGVLITSAEGGRRFANIGPSQTVTIRYRRRGHTADAVLRAGMRCGLFVEGMKMKGPLAGLTGAATRDDILSLFAPGIRILRDAAHRDITIVVPRGDLNLILSKDPVTGRRETSIGEGRLGLRWSCQGSCSATRKARGRPIWQFSGPVRVSGIEVGGPADLAGVQMGDQLTAVNGHPIESKQGGEAASDVQAGQPMHLTLRGPDGRERTVTVVPGARKDEDAPE